MIDKIWICCFALLAVGFLACSDSTPSSAEFRANFFTDSRDQQTYKILDIGGRVWMAENLNYQENLEIVVDTVRGWSGCFNNSDDFCEKQGRLYEWDVAMNACPDGWELPSKADFDSLFAVVGGPEYAADSLKSRGFISEIQGGYHFMEYFSFFENYAYFWTRDEVRGSNARSVMFENGRSSASFDETYEKFALSVRCVQGKN
ncbi:FISUMP domain-containing protein [Fibrobacter sp. UWB12]|uniref:FISUMP domain-containing protein n=1 Tax=Fibrobacter sp. UWB12 TaxID=1896203 RepID=UPI000919F388|nr:FISUMP domain-containing protein [Fibrobacter sp. UWB12]SHK70940.1 major paralogous domain-containing protein [Fibrobacter sp. UWB12]